MLPAWYWWIVAALVVGLSAIVDAARHRPGMMVGAALMIAGPVLTRILRRIMLDNQARGR